MIAVAMMYNCCYDVWCCSLVPAVSDSLAGWLVNEERESRCSGRSLPLPRSPPLSLFSDHVVLVVVVEAVEERSRS